MLCSVPSDACSVGCLLITKSWCIKNHTSTFSWYEMKKLSGTSKSLSKSDKSSNHQTSCLFSDCYSDSVSHKMSKFHIGNTGNKQFLCHITVSHKKPDWLSPQYCSRYLHLSRHVLRHSYLKFQALLNKFQKSNRFLEGSRQPNSMNPFDYGKSFPDKLFTKRFGTITQTKP